MIIHTDTDRFVNEVIEGNEYSMLFKELTVFDVGCNMGSFSLWISKLAKRIYAIDLEKENISLLDKTIKDNDLKNIITLNAAVAGKDGLRTYSSDPIPSNGGSMLGEGTKSIKSYTLRTLLDMYEVSVVDVLKLDVEGAEWEILNTDFPVESIRTIVGEFHPRDYTPSEFALKLEELGYAYTEYPNNHFVARI